MPVATEQQAGYGVCTLAYFGSTRESGLIVGHGLKFDGANAGANCDGIWFNSKGSVFHVTDITAQRLRHGLVQADAAGNHGGITGAHIEIEDSNITGNDDAAVILSNADAPMISECRMKDNGGRGIEMGQNGDRSFAGSSLSGPVTSYNVFGCIIERNHGGFVAVSARGGLVNADFESNDEGASGRAHVDMSGGSTSGAGDWFGRIMNCAFSGGHTNIRARAGTISFGNTHKDGNPCIENTSDQPVYAPFEIYQGGVTTEIAGTGDGGVINTLAPQTFNVRNLTVANGSKGVQVSPRFTLDNQSVIAFAAGVEDATGATSSDYQFYIRNVTDSSYINAFSLGSSYDTGSPGSNGDWVKDVGHVSAADDGGHNAGDEYALFLRNKSGASADLFGFVDMAVIPQ
jgi:hypothetical protein